MKMRKMKMWMLAAILICGATTVLTSCKEKEKEEPATDGSSSVPTATDYSQKSNWHHIPDITKEFDTFYIPATNYDGYEDGDPTFAPVDNAEFVAGVTDEFKAHASAYAASTNVFVPYYRQSSLKHEEECWKKSGSMLTALTGTPYTDITAALDYYFAHYNQGRPFIIAGHSQGSAMTKLVLMNYFKAHPDYYKRMVAAYVIGYAVTKDDLSANPHLKFATGESDAGVVVSWNTEGPANSNAKNMVWMPGAISINPLNWKLDDTYAPASENLGSYVLNLNTLEREFKDVNADAKLNVERGVVVTNATCPFNPITWLFGTASYHDNDYGLFYNNIKENVAKRIATYREINGYYDKSLAVKCINGTFIGKKTENIISFKGIPFVGQQPVGDLRWKAPVQYTEDNGVYEAYEYGKAPYQAPGDPAAEYGESEDCLYLNVWKADENTAAKKPVMVWIYGGGFEVGGTTDPQYDCHNLVKENPDVIFVTITYRLAAYGFMHLSHLPDGAAYPDAQNLGIMDQLMALKWVHENIENFGGDPDNVTIWGESAGGSSCALLSLTDEGHKYFKRAIAMSGSPIMTRSTEEAIAVTNKIMEALECKTVADLQKIAPRTLADKVGELFGIYQVLGWSIWPERDGKLLPKDGWKAYEDGMAKDIDILAGCTKDEYNTFAAALGVEGWNKWAADRIAKRNKLMTPEEIAKVESYISSAPGEEWQKTCSMFSQSYFNAPAIRMSENQSKSGGKIYTYLYTPESALPMVKSGHASELSVVFNHPEMTGFTGRVIDETFSKTMRKMWIQFAKTGNPSLSAEQSPDGQAKVWPLYNQSDKQVMVLDEQNIHPAKESEVKIVDWENTYFLTKYYCN